MHAATATPTPSLPAAPSALQAFFDRILLDGEASQDAAAAAVPTPCLPAALQALIDRILLDGEVSKAALEDDRLGGFREDEWLKPALGS